MKAIREVEFHEFREHLESYLQSGETIAVMQNGRRVGTFDPTIPQRVEPVETSESLDISEDERIEEFEQLRRESRQANRG